MNFRALGLLIAIATLASGCNERSLRPLTPCTISGVSNKLGSDINNVDMLFVIDTSRSMASEQTLLNMALPQMVQALIDGEVGSDCGAPMPTDCQTFRPVKSLRVGIISPDLGNELDGSTATFAQGCAGFNDDGELFDTPRGTSGCALSATLTEPWLQYDDETPDPDFVSDFQCLSDVGTSGCGFEQQAEAVLKSLAGGREAAAPLTFYGDTGNNGQLAADGVNTGFIRANSLISIVVVTDEDDCSATDIDVYDITSNAGGLIGDSWSQWSTARWGGAAPPDDTDPDSGPNTQAEAAAMMNEVDPALNCHLKTEFLRSVDRYVDGILDIRDSNQTDLIVYSVIGGIDRDVVTDARTSTADDAGDLTIDRFQAMLGASSMQETIDYDHRDRMYFAGGSLQSRVTPACLRFETTEAASCVTDWDCGEYAVANGVTPPPNSGLSLADYQCDGAGNCGFPNAAAPARRLIEIAEGIEEGGGSSVIESICQDDFDAALDAIIERIASVLNRACLPSPLNPSADGTVGCDVVEFLPLEGPITTCEEAAAYGGRDPERVRVDEDGREVCRINQIPINRTNPTVPLESDPAGPGWFYDDFTVAPDDIGIDMDGKVETSVFETCGNAADPMEPAQRIAFTYNLGKPIAGASIKLECLQPSVGGDVDNANVATPCQFEARDVEGFHEDLTYDAVCTSSIPGETMICESLSNTCQFSCTSDAECPGGYVCYARPEPAPVEGTACTSNLDCPVTDPAILDDMGMSLTDPADPMSALHDPCGSTGICLTWPEFYSTRSFCANPTCDSTGISD